MKTILLAACAIVAFAAPALANDWTQNEMLEEMRQQRLQQSMQFQQQQLQDQMNANAAAVQQRQQQIYNQSMRMRGW
jgi:opacity protein-like surface antigen